MNKNIENINDKGQLHGYVELYWDNILTYRANFKNNRLVGYSERHIFFLTEYYIR